GKITKKVGSFTTSERDKLAETMLAKLGASKKAENAGDAEKAAKLRDEALLSGVSYVETHMTPAPRVAQGNKQAAQGGQAAPARPVQQRPENEGLSVGQWILIGLAVLLVLWVIIGIFRALAGGGRGAPGYG